MKKTITKYREKITFEPLGPVIKGPQPQYGLCYSTFFWPLDEDKPFHEELGYWLWDKDRKQLLRSFVVPRGVAENTGGPAEADSKSFHLEAEVCSETYGVLSNRYLDDSYKTKRYSLDVKTHVDGTFSYKLDNELWIPVDQGIFHHTDENILKLK